MPEPTSGTAADVVLEMNSVSKHYGCGDAVVHAVQEVSLSVRKGQFVAIMGPSGCGKSTLLALAGGLDEPDGGSVEVAHTRLDTLTRNRVYAHRRRHIGFVFQDYNLIPTLTALENVALPAELDGERLATAREAALHALAQVGIEHLARRFPGELSGGQQQRVAIARALGGGRRLLLADEPTGALDSQSADEVMDVLAARLDDGAAAVVVTHDQAVAERAHHVLRGCFEVI